MVKSSKKNALIIACAVMLLLFLALNFIGPNKVSFPIFLMFCACGISALILAGTTSLHVRLDAKEITEFTEICVKNPLVTEWALNAKAASLPLLRRDLYAARRAEKRRSQDEERQCAARALEESQGKLDCLLRLKSLISQIGLDFVHTKSKAEAIDLIKSKVNQVVDLDYQEGYADMMELEDLGRQFGVHVVFRSESAVIVDSVMDLLNAFCDANAPWRIRVLLCTFDMKEITDYHRETALQNNCQLMAYDLVVARKE